jgi:hypothetical protein
MEIVLKEAEKFPCNLSKSYSYIKGIAVHKCYKESKFTDM